MSDRVAVMYLGQIVESGPTDGVFAEARHPYTLALLSAIPEPDPGGAATACRVIGETPSPIDPPSGCRFHTRCPFARGSAPNARARASPAPDEEPQRRLPFLGGDRAQSGARAAAASARVRRPRGASRSTAPALAGAADGPRPTTNDTIRGETG